MRARWRTGDLFTEPGEDGAKWRVVDYWRDVVELEKLDGSRRRKFFYQEELDRIAGFRGTQRAWKPA